MLSLPQRRSSSSLKRILSPLLVCGCSLTFRLDLGYSILSCSWTHAKGNSGLFPLSNRSRVAKQPPCHSSASAEHELNLLWLFLFFSPPRSLSTG